MVTPPGRGELQAQFDYAWKWFEYHAAQRLMAFNFFLILAGAALVAYASAVREGAEALGIAVGGFGAVVALAFLCLDVRNKQLVDLGGDQLERLEGPLELEIRGKDPAPCFLTHSFWLRAVLGGFLVVAVLGTVWAACGFGPET
jgi:hypothetical protein